MATSPTNTAVEGGGRVSVSSLPDPLKKTGHVYFTVQTKHTVNGSSNQFAKYAAVLPGLAKAVPHDAPCIHLFWTPLPYKPLDATFVNLLEHLRRPWRGIVRDIVACVNVKDCLTPSLAWTLTCAGFTTPSD
jgi:hypothetical protein